MLYKGYSKRIYTRLICSNFITLMLYINTLRTGTYIYIYIYRVLTGKISIFEWKLKSTLLTQTHTKGSYIDHRVTNISLLIINIFKSNNTMNPFFNHKWTAWRVCACRTWQRRQTCSIDFLYLSASTICLANISQDADTISLFAVSVRVVWQRCRMEEFQNLTLNQIMYIN